MAQLFAVNVYQINSNDPIPLASVSKIDFPFAGVMVRGINGGAGQVLSSGVTVYGNIQVLSNGSQYLVIETPAAIQALS
jgi:hypothetical protein